MRCDTSDPLEGGGKVLAGGIPQGVGYGRDTHGRIAQQDLSSMYSPLYQVLSWGHENLFVKTPVKRRHAQTNLLRDILHLDFFSQVLID